MKIDEAQSGINHAVSIIQDLKIKELEAADKFRRAEAEIARLNDVIDVQRLAMIELNDRNAEATESINDLTSATDLRISYLDSKVEDLGLKNTQLKAWLLRLHKSKQELAISYSSDMRTLRAIEERYMATYAQHIRNTPLPE